MGMTAKTAQIQHLLKQSASIIDALGIVFLPPEGENVSATMPADERTCQPFGILSGGASLALAEILAGAGSLLLCGPDERPVGAQVSAQHVASVSKGETVTAVGTLLHRGKSTHLWNIDIRDATGRLISTARVTNHILRIREPASPRLGPDVE